MESLFAEVITKSFALISQQMQLIKTRKGRKADMIILAGGLGSSKYVVEKIQELAVANFGKKLQVIRPLDAWSTVCRGAALHGKEEHPVLFRRCRSSYGFTATEKFDDTKHDEADAYHDGLGCKRARNQMHWPFRKVSQASGQDELTI